MTEEIIAWPKNFLSVKVDVRMPHGSEDRRIGWKIGLAGELTSGKIIIGGDRRSSDMSKSVGRSGVIFTVTGNLARQSGRGIETIGPKQWEEISSNLNHQLRTIRFC